MRPIVAATAVVLLVMLGCKHAERPGPGSLGAEPVVEPQVEAVREVKVQRKCGAIKPEWLRPRGPVGRAEGVIADAVDVSIARGEQIDIANERLVGVDADLAKIAAVLKRYGCAEIAR